MIVKMTVPLSDSEDLFPENLKLKFKILEKFFKIFKTLMIFDRKAVKSVELNRKYRILQEISN